MNRVCWECSSHRRRREVRHVTPSHVSGRGPHNFSECGPMSAEIGPNPVERAQIWPTPGRLWRKLARHRWSSVEFGLRLPEVGASSTQIGQFAPVIDKSLGRNRPNLARNRPALKRKRRFDRHRAGLAGGAQTRPAKSNHTSASMSDQTLGRHSLARHRARYSTRRSRMSSQGKLRSRTSGATSSTHGRSWAARTSSRRPRHALGSSAAGGGHSIREGLEVRIGGQDVALVPPAASASL